MRCWFHKWSKWSEVVRLYSDHAQYSTCTKCGKVKRRVLWWTFTNLEVANKEHKC